MIVSFYGKCVTLLNNDRITICSKRISYIIDCKLYCLHVCKNSIQLLFTLTFIEIRHQHGFSHLSRRAEILLTNPNLNLNPT